MTEPTTSLDPRFSDPASTATPWTDTQRALDAELFWITTVRADGRPHVSPLVAEWLDDAIYFATGEAEQKPSTFGPIRTWCSRPVVTFGTADSASWSKARPCR